MKRDAYDYYNSMPKFLCKWKSLNTTGHHLKILKISLKLLINFILISHNTENKNCH